MTSLIRVHRILRALRRLALTAALVAGFVAAEPALGDPARAANPRLGVALLELHTRSYPGDIAKPHPPIQRPNWAMELVIFSDGRWMAGGPAGVAGPSGQIAPNELAALRRMLARARFGRTSRAAVTCDALPTRETRLRSRYGTVTWQSPCGRTPDASVLALEARAREIVAPQWVPTPVVPEPEPTWPTPEPLQLAPSAPASATLLVRLSNEMPAKLDDRMAIAVMSDGRWQRQDSSGTLAPAELAALLAELDRADFSPTAPASPEFACAARFEGTALFEVPGRGTARWSLPCGRPNPSLSPILRRLGTLR